VGEDLLTELAGTGPLVLVLVWQLHTAQTKILATLDEMRDMMRAAAEPK